MLIVLTANAQQRGGAQPNLRGDEELTRFIEDRFVFPAGEAKRVQELRVEFTLTPDGHVTFNRITRPSGISRSMEQEMKRAFQQVGTWMPSDQRRPQGRFRSVYSIIVRVDPTFHWEGGIVTISKLQAGTLSRRLTPQQQSSLTRLKLEGQLNAADIRTIRRMAGTHTEPGVKGRLEYLDLSKAQVINDDEPYLEIDAAREHILARVILSGQTSSNYPGDIVTPTRQANPSGSYFWEGGKTFRIRFYLNDKWREGKQMERTILDYEKPKWVDFTKRDLGPVWTRICQSGLRKVKGHHIKKDKLSGRYIFTSHPCKNVISCDMFYACPSLKAVVLPWKCETDDQVEVDFSDVKLYR